MQREKRMTFRLVLLSAAVSAVVCDDLFGMRLTTETLKTKESTHYRFHYFVKDDETGDYKSQEETKEGDSVRGSYTLAEPNGDLRTVTYKAGPGTGFEAKVDVHPSGSPMKHATEQTTPSTTGSQPKTVTPTALESNVKRFPGGFAMDILKKPQANLKTEMGMKFTLNANFATEPVTSAVTTAESKPTEEPETETKPTMVTFASSPVQDSEKSTSEISMENSTVTEDPIEKEIDEAENSMPKLPEVILSDNKTHFKFYKDPEEALLDERITQIARQLAETSLRREYEERKLGHFIPISVTSVEPITSSHLSKSIKFTRDDAPSFRPTQQSPLQILAELKLIPQYVYKETGGPKFLPAGQRLPVMQTSVPFQSNKQWGQENHEAAANVPDLLKINKAQPRINDTNEILNVEEKLSTNYETTERETVSVLPIQIPTLLHFFSPYVVPTQTNHFAEVKTQPSLFSVTTVKQNLPTAEVSLNTNTASAPATTVKLQNRTKS